MKGPHDQELDRGVARLPRSIHPERDLWMDIEKRIVALRAPPSLAARRRKFAAASVAALAAAAAVTVLVERGEHRPPVPSPAPSELAASSPSSPVLAAFEGPLEHAKERRACRAAVQALEASLAENLRHLSSRDAERLEQSIAVIDRVIQTTELLLSRDPDNPELQRQLWEAYQQKIDALEAITDLVGGMS